jgi:hypothetical protein
VHHLAKNPAITDKDYCRIITVLLHKNTRILREVNLEKESIPFIFNDESTGSCICLWKLAVAVATYVSICIVYRILPSFAF